MALEHSDYQKNVISKRTVTQGDTSGNPSMTPTKRQKKVGEQEVHVLVPQGEASAEEDGDLGSNAVESEHGITEESSKGRNGRVNADCTSGTQEEIHGGNAAPGAKATDPAHLRRGADEFHVLTRLLRDLLERVSCVDTPVEGLKEDVEKALFKAEALELMFAPGGSYQFTPPSSTIGSPNPQRVDGLHFGSIVCLNPPRRTQCDPDSPYPSTLSSDDDSGWDDDSGMFDLDAPASVGRRQKNDPDLRRKIHKVEVDYWGDRISREVYNEERFKLYTKEEAKEARIVWPRREVYSPAGYRERELESGKFSKELFGGPSWDDVLFEFGCPFEEAAKEREKSAKKRLNSKIEEKSTDQEGKLAEYDRWEKIRGVEAEYHHSRLSRKKYNAQRYPLYSEEEREEKGIMWHEKCYSPAGFRDAVFDQYGESEVIPELQTRMDFHFPRALSPTDRGVENVICELCKPLIEEDRAETRRLHELAAIRQKERAAAREKEWEAERPAREAKWELERQEKEKKKLAKQLAKKNGPPCPECNRTFATEVGLLMHTADKHKKQVL